MARIDVDDDCTEQFQIHGLKWVFKSRRQRALHAAWIAAILAAIICFCVHCSSVFEQYLRKEPITLYKYHSDGLLTLPQFQVCLPTRFSQRKATKIGIPPKLLGDLHYSFFATYLVTLVEITADMVREDAKKAFASSVPNVFARELEMEQFIAANGFADVSELIEELSFNCEEVVQECFMKGTRLNRTECCARTKTQTGVYGRCFVPSPTVQVWPGPGEGFAMRLRPPVDEYFYRDVQFPYDGVLVSLNSLDGYSTVYPRRGGRTNIAVERTRGQYLKTDLNPCEDYSTRTNKRPGLCKLNCIQATHLNCSCASFDLDPGSPNVKKPPVCTPAQFINCVVQKRLTDIAKGVDEMDSVRDLLASCARKCPPACSVDVYRAFSNFIPFRKGILGNESQLATASDIYLDVHYQSLLVTEVMQTIGMTQGDVIASVGGILLLWLGGSALAIAHLATFCAYSIYNLRERLRASKRRTSTQPRKSSFIEAQREGDSVLSDEISPVARQNHASDTAASRVKQMKGTNTTAVRQVLRLRS